MSRHRARRWPIHPIDAHSAIVVQAGWILRLVLDGAHRFNFVALRFAASSHAISICNTSLCPWGRPDGIDQICPTHHPKHISCVPISGDRSQILRCALRETWARLWLDSRRQHDHEEMLEEGTAARDHNVYKNMLRAACKERFATCGQVGHENPQPIIPHHRKAHTPVLTLAFPQRLW